MEEKEKKRSRSKRRVEEEREKTLKAKRRKKRGREGERERDEKCSVRSKEDRVFHCLGRRKFSVKIAPLTPLASLMRIRVPVRKCLFT